MHTASKALDRAVEDVSRSIELYRAIDRTHPTADSAQDLLKSLRLRATQFSQFGRASDAIADLDEALSVHERTVSEAQDVTESRELAEILTQRSGLLESQQRFGEAAADLRRALSTYEALAAGTHESSPSEDFASTLNSLAWLMATCCDEEIRDGATSVTLAERACELTLCASYPYFDTLAAAYAEAGDFESARHWQTRALDAANDVEKPEYRRRLALYEQGKPFRDIGRNAESV